jgi:hypothetical protein
MIAWLSAFLLTELVETPIYMRALLERREQEDAAVFERWPPALGVAFGASAITHPIVWFVMPELIPGSWLTMVLVAESLAIAVEAAWLRAFGLRRALVWAVFANAASVVVGMGLRRIFGWP